MAAKAKESRGVRLNWPPRDGTDLRGPSERQAEFLRCQAKEQLYGGSKRGGKTIAGCAKAINLSYFFPGNRGFILRQAYTDLRESTLTTFFKILPPEFLISHNKTDHHIWLKTRDGGPPSQIVYAGLGEESELTPRAKEKAKSKDSGWFWIDEPSEVSFEAYRMMLAQLCWYLPDGSRPAYMALLTSNPEPGWVKDRFIDSSSEGYIIGKGDAAFIPSLPRDNPGLPAGWESDLRDTMDPLWVTRYLDGSWELHEGMVFGELQDELHNLDRYMRTDMGSTYSEWLKGLRHLASLDHATTGITAYLRMAVDQGENLYALAEYYQEDRRISEHAAAIKGIDAHLPGLAYRLIDPSTEARTLQNKEEMYSVLDAYRREGVMCQPARRAEIRIGIDLIKELLHSNPLHGHPFREVLGAPRLFISRSGCPNLWKEMQALKQEPKLDGTIDYVGRDHAVDDLRYGAMSRPKAADARKLDVALLPSQIQHKIRVEDSFFKNFGRQNDGVGSWY
jgi:hypothetical protein